MGTWVSPPAKEKSVGAFELGRWRRILQVLIAVIYCLLGAGVVFGYAAIKPVLVEQGVYRNLCTREELDEGVWVCHDQELRLNLMFTIAAVSTNVCTLPVGTLLDRFGPRIASMIGAVFLTVGALLFAFAVDLPFDTYTLGYLFLALGGPFIFISSFHLSNTFPKNSGLILALLTGAFDTSSAVFWAYRLIYQGSNGSLTPKKFFLIYLIVPVFVLVAQLLIMPTNSYKTTGEFGKHVEDSTLDQHNSDTDIENDERPAAMQIGQRGRRESHVSEITALCRSKDSDQQTVLEDKTALKSGVWGALHGRTALQQICTHWFILITLFTVVQMLRINYFVASIRTQYDFYLSHDRAIQVNEFFDIALPLGGVIAVPFMGLVLDHTSTSFTLGLLVAIATTIGVFGIIPNQIWAAYANVVLFVLYRPFYYTAVSDYSVKVFGFATFGKVYGLIICLAGLFNLFQYALDALTHGPFNNDPTPVNVLLLIVALVVGLVLLTYVQWKSHIIEHDRLKKETNEAREVLIPGSPSEQVQRERCHQTYGTT